MREAQVGRNEILKIPPILRILILTKPRNRPILQAVKKGDSPASFMAEMYDYRAENPKSFAPLRLRAIALNSTRAR